MRIMCDDGLPGFENVNSYELVEPDEPGPFKWLRATTADLAFIVVDPRLFWPDYSFDLTSADLDSLGISRKDEAAVYVVVTVPDDPLLATANLFAPLVVNPGSGRLKQIPLRGTSYPLSAYLFPEEVRQGKVGLVGACPDAPRR